MTYRTDSIDRLRSKDRRDLLRAMGLCIGGPSSTAPSRRRGITHGPVAKAGKCQRCLDVAYGRGKNT